MTTKHTPGPWRIDAGYPSVNVVGANRETVCEVYTRSGNDRDLIAAAPDLLAALEAIMATRSTPWRKDVVKANSVAVAAIARAKGETK